MANIIEMPKLSDTMTTGTLVKWLKKEGDAVATGDMLAEVETDKATMEMESFFDGTLLKIFVNAGASAPIGAPLCAVGKPGEKVELPAPAAPAAEPPKSSSPGEEAPRPSPPADAAPKAKAAEAEVRAAPSAPASPEGGRLRISPLARKLASEKGVDPSRIKGSGPGGRIVRADILEVSKGGGAKAAGPSPFAGALAAASPRGGPIQEEKLVAVSNLRATIARRLVESKTQIPHFYAEIEIDADPLLTLRAQLNEALAGDGVKLSINDFVLKASAEALARVPAVNCSWEPAGAGAIRQHPHAHVSFAVAIEDGLITPVIRDTRSKTIFAIGAEAKSLAKLAKDKKLQPAQYTGGTFCVSNLGMMGVDRFSAIINPPNAAILAVGAAIEKPVVKDGAIVAGHIMSLTLSVDHRVVDGAVGAAFLSALRRLLESPALLLL
ncbi:MAG: pyruvate dehydrogenase complex dihydrolipoamide acetyltransferase [Opitutaceae bacterium]